MPKINGVTLNLGGMDYVVPPLSLGALEVLQSRIEAFDGSMNKESVATVIDCLHAALRRNYPDITREVVADMVDVANFGQVMNAVMNASGMGLKAADPGNPQAPSSGAPSSPESSPTPDTPQA
jgi:hypothetical protein